ncbi:MAG: zinc dependent phospholipase C family protein [Gemmatimonadaceae bacterium]
MRVVAVVLGALALIALLPTDAHAWTPGTHILLGEALLRSADVLLPASLATLLRAFPYDFLYGSIAADTSFAKRYARVGRHCHAWAVGDDILDRARDDALRAFGYGYLAHLAADVVAHNHFVPHQLAITSASSGVGHSYWESRFETHTGEQWARRAREVILLDHARSDEHLDRVLSPTIFSTPTNRRIFRSMVYVTDSGSWQRVLALLAENSRWTLRDANVVAHLDRAFDYVVELLARGDAAVPRQYDPSGEEALREAKLVRKLALDRGGERAARKDAADRFALPAESPGWAARLSAPLYEPARVANN